MSTELAKVIALSEVNNEIIYRIILRRDHFVVRNQWNKLLIENNNGIVQFSFAPQKDIIQGIFELKLPLTKIIDKEVKL